MNTESLRHLLALADSGSFSEAAARSGVTQPAVSLALKKMERDLGVKLFERSGNRYVATSVGVVFMEHARRVVDAEAGLLSAVERSVGVLTGKLRVATSNIPGEYVLPLILSGFRAEHPDLEPVLEVMDSSRVIDSVLSGRFELGFVGSSIVPDGLELIPFCPDALRVICPPSHPLAVKRSVRPQQLADQKLVLREDGSATRVLMLAALTAAGLDPGRLQVEMELGSTSAVISAVESGAGISMVSSWAAKGPLSERRIESINVPQLKAERQFGLLNPRGQALTPPAAEFKEFVLGKRAFLKKHARDLALVPGR